MQTRMSFWGVVRPPMAITTLVAALLLVAVTLLSVEATMVSAQITTTQSRAVGGVYIDASGVLSNATLDACGRLSELRTGSLDGIPSELNALVPLRKVSLRKLEAAIDASLESGKELPDEIKYLAGLQQIEYVFVYPDERDIILAGPGEGWKVDARGYVVGVTTGRPVLLLDDLLVSLRTARRAARGGISCSIDPTAEGLTQLRAHVSKLRTIGNPCQTASGIEDALGMQQISVRGVPDSSHFARVLVAADYRMKRIAMNFEKSPVAGLPSFLAMIKSSGRGMNNMLPRWWLEPNYEPLLKSADGLAYQLRGGNVKTLTEEDFLTATGTREHTGKANPMAERWAKLMTEKYAALAVADPIFGQLRNCMELARCGCVGREGGFDGEGGLQPADADGPGRSVDRRVPGGEASSQPGERVEEGPQLGDQRVGWRGAALVGRGREDDGGPGASSGSLEGRGKSDGTLVVELRASSTSQTTTPRPGEHVSPGRVRAPVGYTSMGRLCFSMAPPCATLGLSNTSGRTRHAGRITCGPKAQAFSQRRATPWLRKRHWLAWRFCVLASETNTENRSGNRQHGAAPLGAE